MCTFIYGICFTEIFFPRSQTDNACMPVMVLSTYEGMKHICRSGQSRILHGLFMMIKIFPEGGLCKMQSLPVPFLRFINMIE